MLCLALGDSEGLSEVTSSVGIWQPFKPCYSFQGNPLTRIAKMVTGFKSMLQSCCMLVWKEKNYSSLLQLYGSIIRIVFTVCFGYIKHNQFIAGFSTWFQERTSSCIDPSLSFMSSLPSSTVSILMLFVTKGGNSVLTIIRTIFFWWFLVGLKILLLHRIYNFEPKILSTVTVWLLLP